MPLGLTEIDELINRARHKKELSRVTDLDTQMLNEQATLDTHRNDVERLMVESKNYQVAKEACEKRLLEMQELKDFFDSAEEYEHARNDLTTQAMTADEEYRTFTGLLEQARKDVKESEAKLAALRVQKDQLLATIPAIPNNPSTGSGSTRPVSTRFLAPNPVANEVLQAKELSNDERLYEQVKKSGMVKYTKGVRFAIYGGVKGRRASQNLVQFIEKALEPKDVRWFESAGNSNDKENLLASIKNGGVGIVICFDHMGYAGASIKSACKAHQVVCVSLAKEGKQNVIAELAHVYNIAIDIAA